jgi:hypothetical protein
MPVHRAGTKDGKPCWQWGSQKVYCGEGAKAKAGAQGRAAHASGYKGPGKARRALLGK